MMAHIYTGKDIGDQMGILLETEILNAFSAGPRHLDYFLLTLLFVFPGVWWITFSGDVERHSNFT